MLQALSFVAEPGNETHVAMVTNCVLTPRLLSHGNETRLLYVPSHECVLMYVVVPTFGMTVGLLHCKERSR